MVGPLHRGEFVGIATPAALLGTTSTGTTVVLLHADVWTSFVFLRLVLVPSAEDRARREELHRIAADAPPDDLETRSRPSAYLSEIVRSLELRVHSGTSAYRWESLGEDSSHPWSAFGTFRGDYHAGAGVTVSMVGQGGAQTEHVVTPEELRTFGLAGGPQA